MSWIKTIPFEDATGKLKKLYQRVSGPDNNVDNIMLAHSLRPHTMEGHMVLYKNVLHHSGNTLPKSTLEALGVYVSILNQCHYCIEHHFQGYKRLIKDDERALKVRAALETNQLGGTFSDAEQAMFEYARLLTQSPVDIQQTHIKVLNNHGFDDGQILEMNQVIAYFNYANRTVLGLGVVTEGDIIGLSPNDNDDPDNWGHQ